MKYIGQFFFLGYPFKEHLKGNIKDATGIYAVEITQAKVIS